MLLDTARKNKRTCKPNEQFP